MTNATTRLCNHKRCRKPAIMGFRPHKDGWDITAEVGKQHRCELHAKGLLRDGQPFTPATWLIAAPVQTSSDVVQ